MASQRFVGYKSKGCVPADLIGFTDFFRGENLKGVKNQGSVSLLERTVSVQEGLDTVLFFSLDFLYLRQTYGQKFACCECFGNVASNKQKLI